MSGTKNKDVVDLLLEQHQHIRDLFQSVRAATTPDSRKQAFEELRRFLAVHETAEEMVTHPRALMHEGGDPVVTARLEEEHAAKQLLAELDSMDVEDVTFMQRLRTLENAVLAHALNEELEEFPLLRAENDSAMLERMAAAVRATEAIAPTHPHPAVGESLTMNLMAGPLASVIDRTRDAVRRVLDR